MSTEEKLPEKCCGRHEIKKGVHWIAAWNHCFTFVNFLLFVNGVYFILARRPWELTDSDGFDDDEIYEDKLTMWTPGRFNHQWIAEEESKEWYDELNTEWLAYQDSSAQASFLARIENRYELSGEYYLQLRWAIPCLLLNLALFRLGAKRAMHFQKAVCEGDKAGLS